MCGICIVKRYPNLRNRFRTIVKTSLLIVEIQINSINSKKHAFSIGINCRPANYFASRFARVRLRVECPVEIRLIWIPAYAGKTMRGRVQIKKLDFLTKSGALKLYARIDAFLIIPQLRKQCNPSRFLKGIPFNNRIKGIDYLCY